MLVESKVLGDQMVLVFTSLGNYSDYKECYTRDNAENVREYTQGEK